jgi:single-strand DNA-binding protein
MSQGGYVTLVDFVAREPNLRETKDGRHVTDVRVGTTSRVKDVATGEWHDGETSYYNVSCWRRLADHVKASLRKGDPVMIKGRFKTRSY